MADRFYGWHTIYGVDGEHSTPYMTRIWLGRLRLHIFYRGDNDPDPHDHPWDFWTFPLTPYVEEVATPVTRGLTFMEALFNGPSQYTLHRQVVRAFRLSYRPARHCHRVIGRYSGEDLWDYPGRVRGSEPIPQTDSRKIVTIVWRGKSGSEWGFLRHRDGKWCWTPWKEYIFGGGKHAPCEPAAVPSPSPNMDPALIGVAEEVKESGGHWQPCTGCYDTEDGHPTQKYDFSPALQTSIGCGCHECGGLGAVWWHMTDEEVEDFALRCEEIDTEYQDQMRTARLKMAARDVVASASDTYKKRNGHLGSFEDDSGEKCWIVPFDAFEALRSALATTEGSAT